MKPRCALERLALDIFQIHTQGLEPGTHFDLERSGADWWTLVLDTSKSGCSSWNHDGSKGVHGNAEDADDDDADDDDDDDGDDEVGMHFDADYGLEHQLPHYMVHPRVATVTYLSNVGVPTLVLNRKSPPPTDVEKMTLNGPVDKGWLSYPMTGKHIAFDGRLLHGAPGTFFPSMLLLSSSSEEKEKEVEEMGNAHENEHEHGHDGYGHGHESINSRGRYINKRRKLNETEENSKEENKEEDKVERDLKKDSCHSSAVLVNHDDDYHLSSTNQRQPCHTHTRNDTSASSTTQQRITFLVNIWLNHCPMDAELLDDDMCVQMKTQWCEVEENGQHEMCEKTSDDSKMRLNHGCNPAATVATAASVKGGISSSSFIWNLKNGVGKPPDLPKAVVKSVSESLGGGAAIAAGTDECVICGREVDIHYNCQMDELHKVSNYAYYNVEGKSIEIEFESSCVDMVVGDQVEDSDESEEEDDGVETGK
jgi:hypothetical protein